MNQKTETTANNSPKKGEKRQRVPFGGHRRRLNIPDHMKHSKTHRYYWFNDIEDRLERALAAGYEFVNRKELGSRNVGDKDVNNQNSDLNSRVSKRLRGFDIYLMRIPVEYWLEDKAAKVREADKVDESIFGGGADKVPRSYGLDIKYNPR